MNQPRSHRWMQFSLRTALLLVAVIAVIASLCVSYHVYRENQRLRQDNARLRNEIGEITVEEGQEHKLHAIGLPSVEPMMWKWRVRIPADRKFHLYATAHELPEPGQKPASFSGTELESGEYIITVALRKDDRGQWQLFFKTPQSTSWFGVGSETNGLLDRGISSGPSSQVATQAIAEPGNDLQLLRYRITQPSLSGTSKEWFLKDIDTAGPGVLVWIHEH